MRLMLKYNLMPKYNLSPDLARSIGQGLSWKTGWWAANLHLADIQNTTVQALQDQALATKVSVRTSVFEMLEIRCAEMLWGGSTFVLEGKIKQT